MKLDRVQDVMVPVKVVLGGTELSLSKLASLTVGSIIELNKLAGEPVDFVVAGEVVAKGEVVVIDENFGIRLTEIGKKGA
jgi:flagellar motor switch protein FliN/FliY